MERDVVRVPERENGTFNRRQLLQALGVSATTVLGSAWPRWASARQAERPPNPRSFPVTTINHLSYQCGPNYAKIRDWYADLFGGRVAFDDSEECEVSFGDPDSPNGMYIRPAADRSYRSGVKGVAHLAFGIPNILPQRAALRSELERWKPTRLIPNGSTGWNTADPAGYPGVELVPVKHPAMFPSSGVGPSPCIVDADSKGCRDLHELGLRNLHKMPKPSGRGFKALYFTNIVLNVPNDKVAVDRNFYCDLLGMKVLHETPQRLVLRFGGNTMVVAGTLKPGETPYSSRFGFEIENYDSTKVETELKRRGLNPKANTKLAWTIQDPEGQTLDVAGAGFAEQLART
jgi:catechol 2,3-dioxygenase-like lactoylglutathione lyase family enzyme